jgi:hypothetical protein
MPRRGPVSDDGMAIRGDNAATAMRDRQIRCRSRNFVQPGGAARTVIVLAGNRPSHRSSMARRLLCANDGFATPIWLSGRQRPRRTLTGHRSNLLAQW